MRFELLITKSTRNRGRKLIEALYAGGLRSGVDVAIINKYRFFENQVLMLYGMGGPDRLPAANKHSASGGRLVVWDAGYWDRRLSDEIRKYRVSIDGFHPPQFILQGRRPDPNRWRDSGLSVSDTENPNGYILLAGNGPKSTAIGASGWTAGMSEKIRAAFPGQKIAYRPKPKRPAEPGVDHDLLSKGSIEDALRGARLVVCRHSNVAVDACRAGVPVVCEDGAAAAIYPRCLRDYANQPDRLARLEFLRRLAWWQWSPEECEEGKVWPWLIDVLNGPK